MKKEAPSCTPGCKEYCIHNGYHTDTININCDVAVHFMNVCIHCYYTDICLIPSSERSYCARQRARYEYSIKNNTDDELAKILHDNSFIFKNKCPHAGTDSEDVKELAGLLAGKYYCETGDPEFHEDNFIDQATEILKAQDKANGIYDVTDTAKTRNNCVNCPDKQHKQCLGAIPSASWVGPHPDLALKELILRKKLDLIRDISL